MNRKKQLSEVLVVPAPVPEPDFPLSSNRSLHILILLTALITTGCSGLQRSENERIRRLNANHEKIYRNHEERLFVLDVAERAPAFSYPWEERYMGSMARITKEYFRCRGSAVNPEQITSHAISGGQPIQDCGGIDKHGLPYREEREFVYPILIELLNYIQEKMEERVIITTGHRCAVHNRYADPSIAARSSKHQMGAEVDFYVENHEDQPLEVVKLIMQFYQERGEEDTVRFMRAQKNLENLRHPGWYNKEVAIRVHEKDEGRDFDNRHPYPYITIEVRYDFAEGASVSYSDAAARNYIQY